MLREFYCRHRYKRMFVFDFDPVIGYLQLFERYHRLCRIVSFNKADYRTRIRYSVSTKCEHLGELFNVLRVTTQHVGAGSIDLDAIDVRRVMRVKRPLDSWLVDDHKVPYKEDEAAEQLISMTEHIVQMLQALKTKNPALYAYYNQNMQFVLYDVVEILDALLAMQLSLPRRFDVKKPFG